jgi:hypothetical protein
MQQKFEFLHVVEQTTAIALVFATFSGDASILGN